MELIISKPYNPEILSFCDGEKNIKQITEKIPLNYKSVFLRIKELEKEGIVEIKKNKVSIKKELKDHINTRISFFKSNEEKIKEKQKLSITFLKEISKKRFYDNLELRDFVKKLKGDDDVDLASLMFEMVDVGLIKDKLEITKKGKRFLKENETKI